MLWFQYFHKSWTRAKKPCLSEYRFWSNNLSRNRVVVDSEQVFDSMFGIPYRIQRPTSHEYHFQLGLKQTLSSSSGCRPRTRSGQLKIYARDHFERSGGRWPSGPPLLWMRSHSLSAATQLLFPPISCAYLQAKSTNYKLQIAICELRIRVSAVGPCIREYLFSLETRVRASAGRYFWVQCLCYRRSYRAILQALKPGGNCNSRQSHSLLQFATSQPQFDCATAIFGPHYSCCWQPTLVKPFLVDNQFKLTSRLQCRQLLRHSPSKEIQRSLCKITFTVRYCTVL